MNFRAELSHHPALGPCAELETFDDEGCIALPPKKLVRGGVWVAAHSAYLFPLDMWSEVYHRLIAIDVVGESQELSDALERIEHEREREARIVRARLDAFAERLEARGLHLRDYQCAGSLWLATRKAGLFCDEQGLGKTLQVLCALRADQGAIIVCPATLKGWWRDECATWRPELRPRILDGRGAFEWPEAGEVVIGGDAMLQGADWEAYPYPVFLAADEAQAYKCPEKKGRELKTARVRRMSALCTHVRAHGGSTFGLTGTPLQNHPEELYQLAKVFGVNRLGWGSISQFREAFDVKEDVGFGPRWGTPKPEAREGLLRISLRRTREEVLPELPAKTVQVLPIELPRALVRQLDTLHTEMAEDLDAWEWHDKLPTFEKYSQVRAELSLIKAHAAIDWVASHEAADLPVVVFSAFRAIVDHLEQREGWTAITGDVASHVRTSRAYAFQEGTYRGIAGTIRAMGTGLTLTRAAHMLFVDEELTPGANLQAQDRVCRLGQTKPVSITVLIGDHPLEKRIQAILRKKTKLVDAVF